MTLQRIATLVKHDVLIHHWLQRSLSACSINTIIIRTDHLVYAKYKDYGIYDY